MKGRGCGEGAARGGGQGGRTLQGEGLRGTVSGMPSCHVDVGGEVTCPRDVTHHASSDRRVGSVGSVRTCVTQQAVDRPGFPQSTGRPVTRAPPGVHGHLDLHLLRRHLPFLMELVHDLQDLSLVLVGPVLRLDPGL